MSRNPVTEPGRRCQPRPLAAAARGGARKKWPRAMDRSPGRNEASKKATVSLGRDKGDGKGNNLSAMGRRVGTCDQIRFMYRSYCYYTHSCLLRRPTSLDSANTYKLAATFRLHVVVAVLHKEHSLKDLKLELKKKKKKVNGREIGTR